MDKLLSKQQVAEILGISTATIDRWIREKKITVIRVGKQIRIKQDQVDSLLAGTVVYPELKFFFATTATTV